MVTNIVNNIFSATADSFDALAIEIFKHQYQHNAVYNSWVNALGKNSDSIHTLTDIPFMPVSFFKSHQVKAGTFEPQQVFESSGTTGMATSRHFVKDLTIYVQSFVKGFELFYGHPAEWCILGLLPAYLERKGSSLVKMTDDLIKLSGHKDSGFYLYDFERLQHLLTKLETSGQKTLLLGVTFALLDFAEQFPLKLHHTVVMETGGMKGRRKEMIREELHSVLQQSFGLAAIHSEYGMTEMLSQAYSYGHGLYSPPPWMKTLVRHEDDPLLVNTQGKGLINVIDFANIHSCSFIATDDAGAVYPTGNFEILGRSDNSDVRGCSLLYI